MKLLITILCFVFALQGYSQKAKFKELKLPHLLAFHPPTPIYCQIIPTAVSAHVGIPFTHSHPLQNYTDRRCWYAAKDVAGRTNNIQLISAFKRFSVF